MSGSDHGSPPVARFPVIAAATMNERQTQCARLTRVVEMNVGHARRQWRNIGWPAHIVQNFDVLIAQEMFEEELIIPLEAQGFDHTSYESTIEAANRIRGTMIFTRTNAATVEEVWHEVVLLRSSPSRTYYCDVVIAEVRFHEGRRLVIMSVHLDHSVASKADNASNLLEQVLLLAKDNNVDLIGGDWNQSIRRRKQPFSPLEKSLKAIYGSRVRSLHVPNAGFIQLDALRIEQDDSCGFILSPSGKIDCGYCSLSELPNLNNQTLNLREGDSDWHPIVILNCWLFDEHYWNTYTPDASVVPLPLKLMAPVTPVKRPATAPDTDDDWGPAWPGRTD